MALIHALAPRGVAGAPTCLGFSGPTHRCGTVELVVNHEAGIGTRAITGLRDDGCIGLQDSSAHVQNGRGTMVQTVLQNKGVARIKACPGLSSDVPWGWGSSSASASTHNPCATPSLPPEPCSGNSITQLPSTSRRGKRRKKEPVVCRSASSPVLPTSASVPALPYQHFPVLAVLVEASEVA